MRKTIIDAFANPVRLKIICCLAKEKKNVAQLIQTCGLAQSAVSQHLSILKTAKLVVSEKEGKYVYYSLTFPKAATLAQHINTFIKEVE